MDNSLRVVIAAAGLGSRMNSKLNKQYMMIKGRPVLAYALDTFENFDSVESIVVVANPAEIEYCENEIIKKYAYQKVMGVIPGGRERQDSVWLGMNAFENRTGLLAIHDGARPLLTKQLLEELLLAAHRWDAAVPGVLARDTLKMVDDEGFVVNTLNRASIVAVQTPQVFKFEMLWKAFEMAYAEGIYGTDDAFLFEKYIGRVKIVKSDNRNLKITTPEDIAVAQSLLSRGNNTVV